MAERVWSWDDFTNSIFERSELVSTISSKMSDQKPVSMGLQLFPPPPKKAKPARKTSTRRHVITTQELPELAVERSGSPSFPTDGALNGRPSDLGGRQTPQAGRASPITIPGPAYHAADIPRSHTSFSEAPTLIRSNSNSSHNSIAKTGLHNSPPRGEAPVIRSIFPRYNPELALEHQNYFPTQASPTHIPREIINRRPYSPSLKERSPLQSPMAMGVSPGQFPQGISDERIMEPSSNDEMKEFWKVVNGWRVSASEGRSFCMKVTSDPEEPIHTLSSATQSFYTIRLIPTSTSAQLTVARHDPNKVAKDSSSRLNSLAKSPTGMEVLSTTLEETARRLPPNDGLVALLYPRAASNMVIDLANKPSQRSDISQIIAAAERECGRLVWDEDSKKYYLVHPALVTPFMVSINSSPAWSRVEYTLEHSEMPRNLVRLIRDGAGGGFLEVDTAVASKVDCFYIVDVAICAVMLVAIADEKERKVERFEAPPPSFAPVSPKSPKSPRIGSILGRGKARKDIKIEEFEMDLESQESLKDKKEKDKEEKIPGFFGLIWMLLKCFVWTITMFFKALAKVIIVVSKCLTRSKS